MKNILKGFIIVIVFILALSCEMKSFAQEQLPKPNKNAFAVDLMPIVYDLFRYDKQIRVGIDYSRQFKRHWFSSVALDMGLYNDYTYKNYFDFFNEMDGFRYFQIDVKTTGFHLMPSGNYFLLQSKAKQGQGIYAGAVVDLNYYFKDLVYSRSTSLDMYHYSGGQYRIGAGLSVGGKIYMGHHFFTELRTSMFGKVYIDSFSHNISTTEPLNSQWYSENNNFWWVSQIKFGYAF